VARDVCVIVVHGINTDKPGFSERYQKKVLKALPKPLRQNVTFSEVCWAEHLRERQTRYLNKAEQQGLKKSKWRKLAVQALGDAAAYQKISWVKNSSYYRVQRCIIDKLRELETMGNSRPVIFVGHSFGCHIISTFAWDVHTIKSMTQAEIDKEPDEEWRQVANDIRNGSSMVRLDTFAGFITLGNNMPLFTFAYGPERVFPITRPRRAGIPPAFPGPLLPPALLKQARWVNVFSPNDLLGYPLESLNDAYKNDPRIKDIPHHVEPWYWPSPWDAHVKYWTSRRVVRESRNLIREVIEAA